MFSFLFITKASPPREAFVIVLNVKITALFSVFFIIEKNYAPVVLFQYKGICARISKKGNISMDNVEYTREELQELVKKAEREVQELMNKMTPEEREQAALKARKLIEEDRIAMQKLIDDAQQAVAGSVPAEKEAPKFCASCGAPAGTGKFCEYCGQPL